MTLPFDEHRPIKSPALAPAQDAFERNGAGEVTIGLINNMPDSALKATERQFMRLIRGAAGGVRVNFHCFSLPAVTRSKQANEHIAQDYADIADLDRLGIDGLIVTGAEPIAARLSDEPFWNQLTEIIDWAKTNTRSTIWSCLAAHAAVLHLNGVERHRLSAKCSGVFDCTRGRDDWLTRDVPAMLKVSHSRYNELRESELTARDYEILTRSEVAGVDMFARQLESRFIFFQGHPEYDASSLQREYMRDLARYLAGERDSYPDIPAGYFDARTVEQLESFEQRARANRDPMLAAELPGLTIRPGLMAGTAANTIFRNWLGFISEETREPAASRK